MRLVRYGHGGAEHPGILDPEDKLRSLASVVPDIAGEVLSPAGLEKLRTLNLAELPLVEGKPRIAACVGGVTKIIGVGLNYHDHVRQAGASVPSRPVFSSSPSVP